MNIYQETYDMVKAARDKWYETEVDPFKMASHHVLLEDERTEEQKWLFIAKYLQEHASQDIIKAAREKYPILQQLIQNNESEVRS